jgi:tetratricopeptide (TPR) repeat protein
MQKRVPEAIIAYKKAIEINPDKDYYYNLGCVYFTLHDITNAKVFMAKAAEIDSKNDRKELKIQNILKQIRQYERKIK